MQDGSKLSIFTLQWTVNDIRLRAVEVKRYLVFGLPVNVRAHFEVDAWSRRAGRQSRDIHAPRARCNHGPPRQRLDRIMSIGPTRCGAHDCKQHFLERWDWIRWCGLPCDFDPLPEQDLANRLHRVIGRTASDRSHCLFRRLRPSRLLRYCHAAPCRKLDLSRYPLAIRRIRALQVEMERPGEQIPHHVLPDFDVARHFFAPLFLPPTLIATLS